MSARGALTSILLALTLGFACEKRAPGAPHIDMAAAQAGVDTAMTTHFSAFEHGDLDSWGGLLAADVFFTAADPAHVFAGRDSVLAAMKKAVALTTGGGITLSIRPRSKLIWVAEDGRTAGATYDLDYTVSYQDQAFPYRLRSSYLLARDTSGWKAMVAQYSRATFYDTLFMSLVRGRVAGAARVGGQVVSSAGEIVRQFRTDIRDIRMANFASNAAVVTPGSIVEGAEAARSDLAQWLGPAGNATEPGDGVRAQLNPSGTVGWVATNLHVPIFAGPESAIAPMRALFVYRLGENRWEIIQASLSVGWREDVSGQR